MKLSGPKKCVGGQKFTRVQFLLLKPRVSIPQFDKHGFHAGFTYVSALQFSYNFMLMSVQRLSKNVVFTPIEK